MSVAGERHSWAQDVVVEFLTYHGFQATIAALDKEAVRLGWKDVRIVNAQADLTKQQIKERLCTAVEEGNYKSFFDVWSTHVNSDRLQSQSEEFLKMEFYANVYFAVFPVHPMNQGKKVESLSVCKNRFKAYLETNSEPLSKIAEFLPFYALPFVPNPLDHPTFKDIFNEIWVHSLVSGVQKYIDEHVTSSAPPRIYSFQKIKDTSTDNEKLPIIKNRSRGNSGDGDTLLKLVACEHRENKLREMLQANNDSLQQLRTMCSSLIAALDGSRCGTTVTTDYLSEMSERLKRHGGKPLDLKSTSLRTNQPPTGTQASLKSKKNILARPSHHGMLSSQVFAPLNFMKIKEHLSKSDGLSKAYLLQALRWRIIKAQSPEIRKRVIQSYINANIFNVNTAGLGPNAKDLVVSLLHEKLPIVREEMLRLLNVLSSTYSGRAHLSNSTVVHELLNILRSEREDNPSQQNSIGTLQKLSLRRDLQIQMIESDAIPLLIELLKFPDKITEYSLEYSCALLMNLCLRFAGRKKCETMDILPSLVKMLNNNDLQIREYVHGVFYSILKRPSIRAKARSLQLDVLLHRLIETSAPAIRKQLEFVLRQLSTDDADQASEGEDDDGDDDEEDEEDEDVEDSDEFYEGLSNQGTIQGEKLLCSKYLLGNESAIVQLEEVDAAIQARERTKASAESTRPKDPEKLPLPSESSDAILVSAPEILSQADEQSLSHGKSVRLPSTIRLQTELKRGISIDKAHPEEIQEYEAAFGTRARLARTPIRFDRPMAQIVANEETDMDASAPPILQSGSPFIGADSVGKHASSLGANRDPPKKAKAPKQSQLKPPAHRRPPVEKSD